MQKQTVYLKVNDMANLYQTIANNIRTALPCSVKAFELYAHVYPQYSFSASHQAAELEGVMTAPLLSDIVLDDTLDLLQQLKQLDLVQGKIWTQCKITWADNGKATFEFAHIAIENSYPDLFLRGVTDLHEHELAQYEVDEDEWIEAKTECLQAAAMAAVTVNCDVQALFAVAVDYAIGRNGVQQDSERAYAYFERLIKNEATSLAAYYNWAAMWDMTPQYLELSDFGVATIQSRAKKYDMAAQFVLGLMYQSGYDGVAANIENAKQCYFKAAEHGLIPAQLRLDDLCVDSAGLAQD